MMDVLLRAKIREVLAMAPTRRFTEEMIRDALNHLIPDPATMAEVRAAIDWNHQSGFVDYTRNRDADRDEWFLTERGKTKNGIASPASDQKAARPRK